jgi:hypothetical protein
MIFETSKSKTFSPKILVTMITLVTWGIPSQARNHMGETLSMQRSSAPRQL